MTEPEETAPDTTPLEQSIQRLERLAAAVDRAQAKALERKPNVEQPVTAASRLAQAQQALEKLVVDPLSSQADRTRAMVLRDRAVLAAEKEAAQQNLFGQMGRSMSVRADQQAAKDALDRAAAREKAAAKEKGDYEAREEERKWGFAKRTRYINGGQ